MVKNPPANAGDMIDMGSIPGSGRSPGVGNGYPLQYSCLENTMDGGVWQAMVHGISKSRTQLKRLSTQNTHNRIPKRRDFTKRELQRSGNLSKNSKQGTYLHIKVRKGSEAGERTT